LAHHRASDSEVDGRLCCFGAARKSSGRDRLVSELIVLSDYVADFTVACMQAIECCGKAACAINSYGENLGKRWVFPSMVVSITREKDNDVRP